MNMAEAIRESLFAETTETRSGEVNIAGTMLEAAYRLKQIAYAITPQDAADCTGPGGHNVGSLTEAVMDLASVVSDFPEAIDGVSSSLDRIAEAIISLADAVRKFRA